MRLNLSQAWYLALARGADDQFALLRRNLEICIVLVGKSAEVLVSALAELRLLLGPMDHDLKLARHAADSGGQRDLAELAGADRDLGARKPGIDPLGIAVGAVAAAIAAWPQFSRGPTRNGLASEVARYIGLGTRRMPCLVSEYYGDDRHRTGRNSAACTGDLAKQVQVFERKATAEWILAEGFSYERLELALNQTGSANAGLPLPFARERPRAVVVLAYQEAGQELIAKRQLGAVDTSGCRHRRPMSASLTPKQPVCTVPERMVHRRRAAWTTKGLRPMSWPRRCSALIVGALSRDPLWDRHVRLHLNPAYRFCRTSRAGELQPVVILTRR